MANKLPKFDLSNFRYIRRINLFDTDSRYSLRHPVKLGYANPKYFRDLRPDLIDLGKSIGLTKEDQIKFITGHSKRFRVFKSINEVLGLLFYLLLAILGIVVLIVILAKLGIISLAIISKSNQTLQIIVNILTFIVALTAIQMADRISSVILDKRYADTLSFVSCLNLVVQLARKEILSTSEDRFLTLRRVRGLRNYIILLKYQHLGTNVETNNWIQTQFTEMEYFVEEIEKQIITPTIKTRENILVVLLPFLNVLMTEQYGDFKFKNRSKSKVSKTEHPISNRLRITRIAIPLFLLLAVFLFRSQLQFLEPYTGLVSLVLIISLLIAIDTNLNLGVLDRFSNIAKAIKELR